MLFIDVMALIQSNYIYFFILKLDLHISLKLLLA